MPASPCRALLLLLALPAFVAAQDWPVLTPDASSAAPIAPLAPAAREAKLHASLRPLAQATSAAERRAALARLPGSGHGGDQVLVQLDFDADLDRAARSALLARLDAILRNDLGAHAVEVWLRADRLEEAAAETAVARIAPARRIRLHAGTKTSQGVAAGRADLWQNHAPGVNGSGVTIALIDAFDNSSNRIASLQGSGDWPPAARLTKLDYKHFPSGTAPASCTTASFGCAAVKHGNATLEIAYDVAPGASYRAYDTVTVGDWRSALLDAANVNASGTALGPVRANIVSESLGAPLDGIGDGSALPGSIAEAAGWARARGVLVVNSAGNDRQQHWDGLYTASSGNAAFHTFSGSNTPYDFFGDGSGNAYCIPAGTEISVDLYWNNWAKSGSNFVASHDYDLYVYRRLNSSSWDSLPVAQSNFAQSGGIGQTPQEHVDFVTPDPATTGCSNGGAVYGIAIVRVASTTNRDNLEVFADVPLNFRTSARSLAFPADSANVFTVAAIDVAKATAPQQETFSSEGPILATGGALPGTSAGSDPHLKPDVASFDNVTTVTYGNGGVDPPPATSFLGTSASAPHVAGMAALLMQRYGIPNTAATLDSLVAAPLRALAATGSNDLGSSGKDYQYGNGRLRLQKEARLIFFTQPGTEAVNVNFSPAVKARLFDDEGLIVPYSIYDGATLAIASDPNGGAAHLVGGGDAPFSAGVATWSAAHIDLGGFGYTLGVGAVGLTGDTSSSFNITTGLPSRLAFGVQPSAVTAGSKIAPAITVQVLDSNGNLVTSDIATQVSLTRNGCSGVPLRGGGPIKVSNGVATFADVVLNSAGSAQLVASALSRSSATSGSFTVAPNPDYLFRTGFEGCVP